LFADWSDERCLTHLILTDERQARSAYERKAPTRGAPTLAGLAFIIGFEIVGVSGWAKRVSLALKVGHELRCTIERFTQRVGGRFGAR